MWACVRTARRACSGSRSRAWRSPRCAPCSVRLAADTFGKENVGVVYGWIGASHQLGASLAAVMAGVIRTSLGDYRAAFWLSGGLCLLAAALLISTGRKAPIAEQGPEMVGAE